MKHSELSEVLDQNNEISGNTDKKESTILWI